MPSTWKRIEKCLLPSPEIIRFSQDKLEVVPCSTISKVKHYAANFFKLVLLLSFSPFTLLYDWYKKPKHSVKSIPNNSSQSPPAWPPKKRGFATSHFQTIGLGTKWSAFALDGRCDWDAWMSSNPKHIAHKDGFDYKDFFTDILSDPTAYIQMLKEQNVTSLRFSLEWSVFEPEEGKFNQAAIDRYKGFIATLVKEHITPSITLSHFVVPEWFYKKGNFQKLENVGLFIRFATKAMEAFPEVKDWWSFNEIGIKAFQQAREVYPTDIPVGSSLGKRVHAGGIATRNMLIAHCKLHIAVSELNSQREKGKKQKLGVTHQWLQFDTASDNPLERLFAYYFSKFSFTSVYKFFKKGTFSFEFPFMANIRLEISKKEFEQNNHFLRRLGVQAYPKSFIKIGLNHGQKYPGIEGAIKNIGRFTFGSTCEPGGTIMRFGPRYNAKAMDEILDQAFALTPKVYITEFGSDASVHKWCGKEFVHDDEAQGKYLCELTEKVEKYSITTHRRIKGLYCWSDNRRQLEWDNGFEVELGVINNIVDENRRFTGYTPTPASKYLADVYGKK